MEGWYRIDTGSEFTVHIASRDESLRENAKHRHQGVAGLAHVRRRKIQSLKLGEVECPNIHGFEEYIEAESIAGTIGNQILKDVAMTMDFGRGLARFKKLK